MGGQSWSYDDVRTYFSEHGCELVTTEYVGCNAPLVFVCPCGTAATTCFRQFKSKEGAIRCRACAMTRKTAQERDRHGGVTRFQTAEFKAQRTATNRARYGVDNPLQSEMVKQRRRATNKARYGVEEVSLVPEIAARQKAGFEAKYGVSHFMQVPASVAKFRATMVERYGAPSLAFVSRRSSTEASEFLTRVYNGLPVPHQEHCYYSPHTREFNVWYEGSYYKYDFVESHAKRCIEYNGSRFHPRPEQDDAETGWCLYHPTRTVAEARAYEAHKLGALRARGFQVLVIWDHEVKSDPEGSVRRCLEFVQD